MRKKNGPVEGPPSCFESQKLLAIFWRSNDSNGSLQGLTAPSGTTFMSPMRQKERRWSSSNSFLQRKTYIVFGWSIQTPWRIYEWMVYVTYMFPNKMNLSCIINITNITFPMDPSWGKQQTHSKRAPFWARVLVGDSSRSDESMSRVMQLPKEKEGWKENKSMEFPGSLNRW